jgi:hypothetical protein
MEENKQHEEQKNSYPTSLTLEEILEITAEMRLR